MQKEAYRLTGFTAVIAAGGFLLRWLQSLHLYAEETGLAVRGLGSSALLVALMVAVCAVLTYWVCVRLRGRTTAPRSAEEALGHRTVVYRVLGVAAAVLLVAAGVLQLREAEDYAFPVLRRLLAALLVLTGVGAGINTLTASRENRRNLRCAAATVATVTACFWLVVLYKEVSAEPVIWRYAVEVLALVSGAVALYYLAGYPFGDPRPYSCLLFCEAALFFNVMTVIDEHAASESLAFAAAALLFGCRGYALACSLRKKDIE